MHLILWIFVGMVVGTLAKRRIPTEGPATFYTGVAGALAAGWLFQAVLHPEYGNWIWSTLVAFVGAVVAMLLTQVAIARRIA